MVSGSEGVRLTACETAFWVAVSEGLILTSWRKRKVGKFCRWRKSRREACGCVCKGDLEEVKKEVMGCWMKGDMPLMFQLKSLNEDVRDSFCFSMTVVFAIRRRFSGGGEISRSIVADLKCVYGCFIGGCNLVLRPANLRLPSKDCIVWLDWASVSFVNVLMICVSRRDRCKGVTTSFPIRVAKL